MTKHVTRVPDVLLVVRGSWGEIDWIMPVLHSLCSRGLIRLHVYFWEQGLYEERCDFSDLWRVLEKSAATVWDNKALRRLDSRIGRARFFWREGASKGVGLLEQIKRVLSVLVGKTFIALSPYERLVAAINKDVKLLLHEYGGDDFRKFYQAFPDARVVVFPHGTPLHRVLHNTPIEKKIIEERFYHTIPRNADLLLGNETDVSYFRRVTGLKSISVIGYPKFDQVWIDYLRAKTDPDSGRKRLLFLPIPARKIDGDHVFRDIVSAVSKLAQQSGYQLVIKRHPRQNRNELEECIAPERRNDIIWAKCSVITEAIQSCVAVAMPSSSIMDVVSCGVPVAEFFDYNGQQWPSWIKTPTGATSAYRQEGLAESVNTEQQLQSFLRKVQDDSLRMTIITQQRGNLARLCGAHADNACEIGACRVMHDLHYVNC